MSWTQRQKRNVTSLIVIATATLVAFQNCSHPTRFQNQRGGQAPQESGGVGGVDGKVFGTYARCADNKIGMNKGIVVDSARLTATLVRENCQDLAVPRALDYADVQFAINDSSVLQMDGEIFDLQTSGNQRVTIQLCNSSAATPAVQSLIWKTVGSSAVFGSVALNAGSDSGALNMSPANGTFPMTYAALGGQASQFTLTLSSAASGDLTYSLHGGAQISVAMNCSSQSLPELDDGSSRAPAGSAQKPTLLDSYVSRPSWKVAGVEYAVGIPAGMALKNPLTDPAITSNPKIVVDASNKLIRVQGDNVTLDGYDFGDYRVYIASGNDTVVSNSKVTAVTSDSGVNLTVTNCILDGTGASNLWTLIGHRGTGKLTVEYNWMKNFPEHAVEAGVGDLVYRYNLIENGGTSSGLSYLQLADGPHPSVVVDFNTVYQPVAGPANEGFRFYSAAGAIGAEVAYNTVISLNSGTTNSMTYAMHIGGGTQYASPVTATVHDNFFDPTGAFNPFYLGINHDAKTDVTYSSNFDMTDGQPFTTDP